MRQYRQQKQQQGRHRKRASRCLTPPRPCEAAESRSCFGRLMHVMFCSVAVCMCVSLAVCLAGFRSHCCSNCTNQDQRGGCAVHRATTCVPNVEVPKVRVDLCGRKRVGSKPKSLSQSGTPVASVLRVFVAHALLAPRVVSISDHISAQPAHTRNPEEHTLWSFFSCAVQIFDCL